jgi:hypothetical protein
LTKRQTLIGVLNTETEKRCSSTGGIEIKQPLNKKNISQNTAFLNNFPMLSVLFLKLQLKNFLCSWFIDVFVFKIDFFNFLLWFFQIHMNPVGETIVDSFFPKSVDGSEVLNEIHFQQFVRTFAVFRPIHKSKMSYLQAINSVDNKVYIFLFE